MSKKTDRDYEMVRHTIENTKKQIGIKFNDLLKQIRGNGEYTEEQKDYINEGIYLCMNILNEK